jgi:hypothetical protein
MMVLDYLDHCQSKDESASDPAGAMLKFELVYAALDFVIGLFMFYGASFRCFGEHMAVFG